jgi:hypothetical protein
MGATNLVAANEASQVAQKQAAEQLGQVAPGGQGVPTAGSTTTLPDVSAAGGNAPGGTGPQTVPYGTDIIQERARAANLAQVAYEQQSLEQILGLKEQELSAEGSISASFAARGIKTGQGTAGIKLATQKQAGEHIIGAAETQQTLLDKSQVEMNLASYNAGLLNLSNQTLGINQQLQTTESNIWLSQFTSTVQWGTAAISKFWNPTSAMGGAVGASGGSSWETASGQPYYY